MSSVNYSKWDHIEVSDDEDDTHPNVDTASLFKWRHEARLQREEEERRQKAARRAELERIQQEKERLAKEAAAAAEPAKVVDVTQHLSELQAQEKAFLEKEAELERQEKLHPKWNVDNISKDAKSRTIINTSDDKPKPQNADSIEDLNDFIKKYSKEIKHFGMLEKAEDSHTYLKQHMHLVCEHLASYLVIWCVDLEVEEKHALMLRVAKQTICVQFILELARSVQKDPRQCVDAFYIRLKNPEKQYTEAFDDEYKGLVSRVQDRAKVRLREAEARMKAEEEKARQERMQNGLDPLEVLESLPEKIKKAFQEQNTPLLKEGFAELTQEQFKYHYKRVVDSGLWVPQGGAEEGAEGGEAEADDGDASASEDSADEAGAAGADAGAGADAAGGKTADV